MEMISYPDLDTRTRQGGSLLRSGEAAGVKVAIHYGIIDCVLRIQQIYPVIIQR